MDASVPVNPRELNLGSPSSILTGTSNQYYVRDFPGLLSIKSVLRGTSVWQTAEERHVVNDSSWLLLNHGQHYSMTIDSPEPVETFVLFLRHGLVEEAAAALTKSGTSLLDNPQCALPMAFGERARRHESAITPVLRKLRRAVRLGSPYPGYLEEQFQVVAGCLVESLRDLRQRMARLTAVRASTREEVFRRLERTRDFMEGSLDRPVQLQDMAQVACMSSFHFHRQFTLAFGNPPHKWLALRRMEEELRLLEETDLPVSQVCLEVGFQSLGSFSALFGRHYRLTPSAARAAARKKQA